MAEAAKVRPMIAAKEKGPGPGRYLLPSAVGSSNHDQTKKMSASFSFGTKLPNSIIRPTAGPGPAHNVPPAIQRTGKDEAPKYSMAGRPNENKLARTPAPGAYSPEKVKIDKGHTAPAYTMRQRTALKATETTPAANAYAVSSVLSDSPISTYQSGAKYSMTGRSNVGGFADNTKKTPGPGKYQVTNPDVYKTKAGAYSMAARTFMPSDQTKKPGPGAHTINTDAAKKKAPAFSMGVRHSEYLTPLIVDVPDF